MTCYYNSLDGALYHQPKTHPIDILGDIQPLPQVTLIIFWV